MADDASRMAGAARLAGAAAAAMAALAPWAFGSVEAWAELALSAGVILVAALAALAGRRYRPSAAGLALAGLAALAAFQAAALPAGAVRTLAPGAWARLEASAPAGPSAVAGGSGGPVAPPAPALSVEPEASANAAARLAAAWVLFEAVLALGAGRAGLRRFGAVLVLNATALGLFALVQALTWDGKIFWARPSPSVYAWFTGGPFVSHNHLAAYVNLGLGFALAGLLPGASAKGSGLRMAAGYCAAVLAAALAASHSRSGMVGALGAAALLAPSALRGWCGRTRATLVAALAGVSALVLALVLVAGAGSAWSRLGTVLEADAYEGRRVVWGASLRAWAGRPAWGSGLGTFPVASAPYFEADHGVAFLRAENEYLDMLTEGGLVGLGLLLALLGSTAWAGLRALRASDSGPDRAAVLGALFGVSSLAIQSLADFCLHIPGVAVAGLVLAAHLASAGRESAPGAPGRGGLAGRLAWAALLAVAVLSARQGLRVARAEAALAGSDVPLAGSAPRPSREKPPEVDAETLADRRARLEAALRARPDWAEGHLRLGLTLLDQYRLVAAEWLAPELADEESGEPDPEAVTLMSDPLWLHAALHDPEAGPRPAPEDLLQHEPIRLYLAPAARAFLEARRCAPTLALTHARLAGLDFLLDGDEPASAHLRRALDGAGAQSYALALAARVAVQAGEPGLAARAMARRLAVDPRSWEEVADLADLGLEPDQILGGVLAGVDPELTLRFADRLFPDPDDDGDRDGRERFARAALARLGDDPPASAFDRLRIEAGAHARLGEADAAIDAMGRALALEPSRQDCRRELVRWLLAEGRAEAAHREALLGLALGPPDPELSRAAEQAAAALARGDGG